MKIKKEQTDGEAPFFGSWSNIYLFVLVFLILTVFFIYFFCEHFK